MRKLKTTLILLLTLGLAVLLSTAALADDATSGTCGENVTWTLNTDTGVLTISGEGEMEDYSGADAPWYSQQSSVISVVIENGVTNIGSTAFEECTNLTNVTIPDSITSIGDEAFYDCTGLTSVTIPDSVTDIGNFAFSGCTSLTSVTIPDSVTSIGDEAFYDCTGLTEIQVSTGNTAYSSKNGVLFNKDETDLICYPAGKTETSYKIPNSVTSIGYSAFYNCSSLTSVTIPDSVTSIGDDAFYGCTGLTSVTIPDSVTSIGELAFSGCTGLTDVYYGGSEAEWNEIKIYGDNEHLTSATIHYNSTGPEDETGDSTTPGDLNGDGEVNAGDLTILARHVGKVETMEDETALANADVTGDGNVDASDLTRLAQYVGKIISALD